MFKLQLIGLLASAAAMFAAAVSAEAQTKPTEVSIDLSKLGQPFRGWGTSLAWWAHGVGTWDEKTVDEIVHLATDPTDGLGLNMFRYNIGGGDQPGHSHIRRWGDVPGFKVAADADYDWEADAAQIRVLKKLIATTKGKPIVEAFSNSPPWWMTVSGCVSGAADGGANLKPEFEKGFADYLADVAAHFKRAHGIAFDTLEPFNEPDVNWWKANGSQEGLHIPRDQIARIIRLSRAALDERGLRDTLISATDSNSIDDALKDLESFDAETLAALGQVNTHSYYGHQRVELREAAAKRGKPLWQSESGPLYVKGDEYAQCLVMAGRIVLDINQLRPEVWATWQYVGGGPWGCLHEDIETRSFRIGKMFHVLATYSRAIRPGDRFVELDRDDVCASVSQARGEVTIVVVNQRDQPTEYVLKLSAHTELVNRIAAVRTSRAEDAVQVTGITLEGQTVSLTAPPESITRIVIPLAQR